jgi:(R,R)-butanediol dehydrogenase / meso-butanediol dehydrogenase / diacetyl reductase
MKGATMKALVYTGPEKLEFGEREVKAPAAGEALVRVRCSGICGTDLSILAGKHPRARAPLIMGHELAGEIVEIGGGVETAFRRGDHVTAEPLIKCGTCFACRSGFSYVCQNLKLHGIDSDGAFAEYVTLPVATLYRIPENLDYRLGALIEPTAVAVHAVRFSSLKLSDSVCIIGAGPIGLLIGLVARLAGPGQVILCERDPSRIALARDHGFTVIDTAHEDPLEATLALTSGRGMDIVFEAAGGPSTHIMALKLCRIHGEVIQVAMPKDQVASEMVPLTFKELTVKGLRVYAPFDFARAIGLVADSRLDLSRWMTRPYSLAQGVEAFRLAKAGSGVLRVLFEN